MRHMPSCSKRLSIAFLASLLGWPRASSAQEIRAFLFDSVQGVPVSGGFVLLVGGNGDVLSRILNQHDGLVGMAVPGAGRYRLRYERVGVVSAETDEFQVDVGDVFDMTFNLAFRFIDIPISTASVCGDPSAYDGPVRVVWNEIRKMADAVSWLEGRDLYLHRTLAYRGSTGDALGSGPQRSAMRSGMYRPPLSHVSEEQLETYGYVGVNDGQPFFFLPDPGILVNSHFLATHCFDLIRAESGTPGLTFTPTEEKAGPDVRGTLWLDPETARPQSLEFAYVDTPSDLSVDSLGGSLTFVELATGAWIVDSWRVRVPGVMVEQSDTRTDEGEEVLELVDQMGTTLYDAPGAALVGTVYDSTTQGPLSGATVLLEGTQHQTRTDGDGGYRLSGRLAGTYGVTFFHPRLDSVGFHAPVSLVSLHPGRSVEMNLHVPNLEEILDTACNDEDAVTKPFITGAVVDQGGRPVPFAEVFVSSPSVPPSLRIFEDFDEVQGVVTADNLGRYTICGAMRGARISLRAKAGERRSGFVTLVFGENGVMRSEAFHEMTTRVWRQDLTLLEPERQTAQLEGTVTDTTGNPFANANVRLIGTDLETTTDSTGHFAFAGLPSGWTRLEARSVGYRSVERDVELRLDGILRLNPPLLTLVPIPIELADIVVTADAASSRRRPLMDFEERRRSGQGTYMTRDEFMRAGAPVVPSDILRTVPGLRVYKEGLSTIIESSRGAGNFNGPCSPSIYLDNMYLGNSDLDRIVNLEHIEAVEVYSGATAPLRFNRGCGAIVIWTR